MSYTSFHLGRLDREDVKLREIARKKFRAENPLSCDLKFPSKLIAKWDPLVPEGKRATTRSAHGWAKRIRHDRKIKKGTRTDLVVRRKR